jgi:hypothetical protein
VLKGPSSVTIFMRVLPSGNMILCEVNGEPRSQSNDSSFQEGWHDNHVPHTLCGAKRPSEDFGQAAAIFLKLSSRAFSALPGKSETCQHLTTGENSKR